MRHTNVTRPVPVSKLCSVTFHIRCWVNVTIANGSTESTVTLEYQGTTVRNLNCIRKEGKSSLNSGNHFGIEFCDVTSSANFTHCFSSVYV
jgi:hypothetical protein